jgi:hypothetical protein
MDGAKFFDQTVKFDRKFQEKVSLTKLNVFGRKLAVGHLLQGDPDAVNGTGHAVKKKYPTQDRRNNGYKKHSENTDKKSLIDISEEIVSSGLPQSPALARESFLKSEMDDNPDQKSGDHENDHHQHGVLTLKRAMDEYALKFSLLGALVFHIPLRSADYSTKQKTSSRFMNIFFQNTVHAL